MARGQAVTRHPVTVSLPDEMIGRLRKIGKKTRIPMSQLFEQVLALSLQSGYLLVQEQRKDNDGQSTE